MEPMNLGSPVGSPTQEQYLPAFLLGDNCLSPTLRRNKLSPIQERHFPVGNRSPTQQSIGLQNESDRSGKPLQNNIKGFGPPIIDLYDDMPSTYKLPNDVFTPQSLLRKDNSISNHDSSVDNFNLSYDYRSPLSFSRLCNQETPNTSNNMAYRSPYSSPPHINHDLYNFPNSTVSCSQGYKRPYGLMNNDSTAYLSSSDMSALSSNFNVHQEFWVTIFGFPSELTREVLDFFKRAGEPTDVHLKPSCNYVSVKYATRYEARQALMYNGALYKSGIVIGVMLTEDPDFVGKDIINIPNEHMDYKSKMERLKMLSSPVYPRSSPNGQNDQQKSNGGIVNKAIEYIWGW